MATNYYCLVASLREYQLDGDLKGFDAKGIIEEIAGELVRADRKALGAFLLYHDVCNLINLRAGREAFSTLGNFSREELTEELENPTLLPAELAEVIALYGEVAKEEVDADDPRLARVNVDAPFERELFAAYYRYCATSGCRFVREWAEADRNLRNITAAVTARQRGMTIGEVVVGEGDVVAQLSRSSAVDFGLKGELTYIDNLIAALGDNQDLLDKEHRIDLIRWNMAEELATFDYFNINYLLSYVARLGLVHRWAMLDAERGKEMFRRLVGSLGAKEQIAEAESRYAAE
jgi:hypothetical protein